MLDTSKTHRRIKVKESNWGFLECRVVSGDDHIWFNEVGMYGFSSAGYWWSKMGDILVRLLHYTTHAGLLPLLLLYTDDWKLLSCGVDPMYSSAFAF